MALSQEGGVSIEKRVESSCGKKVEQDLMIWELFRSRCAG